MELGFGPSHIVLDRDPAPLPKKGAQPPIIRPCLLWSNGWMDQDAAWYGGRPGPSPHGARWGSSTPPKKGSQPPNFRPLSIVIKGLDGS